VLLVVLFHASIGPFSGGFVGVDVFFVLSGFLITGLLARELDATGRISLPGFYARRVRRLLPAALLVLVATLVASILWLPPLLVPRVAADAAAASAYVSNIGFALQATDYFSAGQAPSPILHYWSLGVEEQFYLLWPALLLLAAGATQGRTRRLVFAVVGVTAVSFALSLWLTTASQPWAFFSLPTRAWELGLGAVLALGVRRLEAIPARVAAIASWAGLAMVVGSAVVFDAATPFPGTAALVPTVGAALVVAAGAGTRRLGVAPVLSMRIPTFLGRISYSLYLWHWPVLVIPAVAAGADLDWPARIALVALSIGLAALTQRFVEDPFRRGRIIGARPRLNLAMAGAIAVTVAIGSLSLGAVTTAGLQSQSPPTSAAANRASLNSILSSLAPSASPSAPSATHRLPSAPEATSSAPHAPRVPLGTGAPPATSTARTPMPTVRPSQSASPAPSALPVIVRPSTPDGPVPANLEPSIGSAHGDYPESYLDGCHTQEDGHPNTGTCLFGNLNSPTTIALFGDSHALAWFPAMDGFAQKEGWRLLSLTMSTCSPAMIPIWVPNWNRVSWECNDWRNHAIAQLVAAHPALIVIAGTRGFATTDSSGTTVLNGAARTATWQAGIQRTLAQLEPAAKRVVVLADTPLSRLDPPECLSQHANSVLSCATPVDQATNPAWTVIEAEAAARDGAGFVDPGRWVCPTSPCPVVLGNFLIYRDSGHLTATFAQALADQLGGALLGDLKNQGIATVTH
jgi:peptidoglycan/LPS O-acetylase OafA/YrhL